MATKRQLGILLLIVDEYIKTGEPVSSSGILKKFSLGISSATIRNEMVALEKERYIEKAYKASGRTPTNKGYEYFIENVKSNPNSLKNLTKKIDVIFEQRKNNIDDAISETMKIISKATHTLSITREENDNLLIEDLKIYKVNEALALVVAISSSGKLYNNEISIKNFSFNDIENSFKIISERLIGTKITEIDEKISLISELVINKLSNVESNFKDFIESVIKKLFPENEELQGMNSLMESDMSEHTAQLKKILELIENKTIWELIDGSRSIKNRNTEILIDFNLEDMDNVSVINKVIKIGNRRKKITFIGSKNQDYEKLITMMELLDEKIRE